MWLCSTRALSHSFPSCSLLYSSIAHSHTGHFMNSRWTLFKKPRLHHDQYERLFNLWRASWRSERYTIAHLSQAISSFGGWTALNFINGFKKKKEENCTKEKIEFWDRKGRNLFQITSAGLPRRLCTERRDNGEAGCGFYGVLATSFQSSGPTHSSQIYWAHSNNRI
jgi:hypothetical protein